MKLVERRSGKWSPGLGEPERQALFAIATDTLAWCVGRRHEPFAFDSHEVTPKLEEEAATFVTLKVRGTLRGCIGSLAPVTALYRSVHENAVNAAMHDSRFQPVSPSELATIDISISILSPIVAIESIESFNMGEHGIILEKEGCRAVYLPEVAIEQGWTREETLSSLSRKAGMHADAWREGATFQVFSSVVLALE